MIVVPRIPFHRLILSLAEVLNFVHHRIADHQRRVAYIVVCIARQMGLGEQQLRDLFYASAVHDIGMVFTDERISFANQSQLEALEWHGRAGYSLLREVPAFAQAARIILHHHRSWADGRGATAAGEPTPQGSHVLVVADTVERWILWDVPILEQHEHLRKMIDKGRGTFFHPDVVEAFQEVARSEAFWLDVASDRVFGILVDMLQLPMLEVDDGTVQRIAEIFGRIVDARSPWTAVHTAGVSATVMELGRKLHFSPRELGMLAMAGHFHDVGKLAVPSAILDKPGKLDPAEWSLMKTHTYHTFRMLAGIGGMETINEWASFHHERLDGQGYPFRHPGRNLSLGSRAMAVADIFTALKEDRPYRRGMSSSEAMAILDKNAAAGGIDGDVVAVLRQNVREIDDIRLKMQQRAQAHRIHVRHGADSFLEAGADVRGE